MTSEAHCRPPPIGPPHRLCREWAAVVLASVVVTLVIVQWVGSITIYTPELEARRQFFHDLILSNQLPPGKTWEEFGANHTNIRVLTVALADSLANVTGFRLTNVYKLIDGSCLLVTLLLVYAYLKRWFDPPHALAGLLLLSAFLCSGIMRRESAPFAPGIRAKIDNSPAAHGVHRFRSRNADKKQRAHIDFHNLVPLFKRDFIDTIEVTDARRVDEIVNPSCSFETFRHNLLRRVTRPDIFH